MSKPSIGNLTEQSAKISVLKNESWMGKRFYIDEHHVLQKQANGLFKKGHVRVCNTPRAADLLAVAEQLQPQEALCLGVPVNGQISAPVVTRKLQQHSSGCITRTKDDFWFSQGEGWLLIDHDTKELPDPVKANLEAFGGAIGALTTIWPELERADYLIRPSSSAGVYMEGREPADAGGFHMFVRLANARDIPQALQTLQSKCWEHGLAYHQISKSGQLLERSILDVSVGSPERLIFTAAPMLGAGVLRRPPPTVCHDGAAIGAPLGPQSLLWSRQRDINRQQSKPAAEQRRDVFLEECIESRMFENGETYDKAASIVKARVVDGYLYDDDSLELPSGRSIRVADLLDRIKPGDVVACADPVEGRKYNPTAAAVIWKAPHPSPALVSHAHGLVRVFTFARFEPFSNDIQGAGQ